MTQFIRQDQLDETIKVTRALYHYRRLYQTGEEADEQFIDAVASLIHMITSDPWKQMTEDEFINHLTKFAPRPQA